MVEDATTDNPSSAATWLPLTVALSSDAQHLAVVTPDTARMYSQLPSTSTEEMWVLDAQHRIASYPVQTAAMLPRCFSNPLASESSTTLVSRMSAVSAVWSRTFLFVGLPLSGTERVQSGCFLTALFHSRLLFFRLCDVVPCFRLPPCVLHLVARFSLQSHWCQWLELWRLIGL
jgi:hypothetical protein